MKRIIARNRVAALLLLILGGAPFLPEAVASKTMSACAQNGSCGPAPEFICGMNGQNFVDKVFAPACLEPPCS